MKTKPEAHHNHLNKKRQQINLLPFFNVEKIR